MLAFLQEQKQHTVWGVSKKDEFKVRLYNLTMRKKPTALCSYVFGLKEITPCNVVVGERSTDSLINVRITV